jgi:hypothetical protein
MPSPLPNIPMMPVENVIRQSSMIDTLNLASSFFMDGTGKTLLDLKELLVTLRRIMDGRVTSILRSEALDLYNNLGLTTISDTSTASQSDLVIEIAAFYVYKSANP